MSRLKAVIKIFGRQL